MVHAAAWASSYPSTAAVALCLFSIVEPSCLSAGARTDQCLLITLLAVLLRFVALLAYKLKGWAAKSVHKHPVPACHTREALSLCPIN